MDWSAGVWFRAGARNFSLLHSVQTGCGAHPASYPMGTAGVVKGKVVLLRCYLSTTPWRLMGKWRYNSTILNLSTRWRWEVSFTPLPRYRRFPLEKKLGGRAVVPNWLSTRRTLYIYTVYIFFTYGSCPESTLVLRSPSFISFPSSVTSFFVKSWTLEEYISHYELLLSQRTP
jgi:hypothetical protein